MAASGRAPRQALLLDGPAAVQGICSRRGPLVGHDIPPGKWIEGWRAAIVRYAARTASSSDPVPYSEMVRLLEDGVMVKIARF